MKNGRNVVLNNMVSVKLIRRLVAAVVVTLVAVPGTPTRAEAAAASRQTTLRVYRLASNDGRYEAGNGYEWVASTGNDMVPVSGGAPAGMVSGQSVRLRAGQVAGASSLSAGVVSRAPRAGDVRKWSVMPNRRVTVVPVQWSTAPWTAQDAANAQDNSAELTPWWNAMSARQETLSMRVLDVLDVSRTVAGGSCNISAMAEAARAEVKKRGLDTVTDHMMVVFTTGTKECTFAGLAEVSGTTAWAYSAAGYAGVWAHELGHNLGFPHANACNAGVTLTYMATCTDVEYGNNADVMGSSMLSSFYSPTFLASVGFLPAANRVTWAGAPATYTIARADKPELGVTAVNIPATDTASGDNAYWLQYNPNRIGAVPQVSTPANGGIAITVEPSPSFVENVIAAEGVVGKSNSTAYICDLTPPTADLAARDTTTDPRLAVGKSWTDPRNRFTVTLVSADGNNAVVKVEPVADATVWAYSTVTVTPDPSGLTDLNVAWSPIMTNIGSDEPTAWEATAAEDPTKACGTAIHVTSCRFTGVSRSATYTVRVRGTNGALGSAMSVAGQATVPVGPPTFSLTYTSTDTDVTAVVSMGDGGSTVTGTPTLALAGLPPCTLTPNADTTCVFAGLPRRATHTLVATGTNATGTREKTFNVRTLAGLPESPELGGKMAGSDLVVTMAPSSIDVANVDYYYLQCSVGGKTWSKLEAADLEHRPKGTFRVPGVKGKATWCYSAVVAMGATKQFTSDFGSVKVTAGGKVTVGKLSLNAIAASAKTGLISFTWKASDTLGKNVKFDVKASLKNCARASNLSCAIKNLPSGTQVTIRL
ncbi:MAG: hypothetical protein RJB57_280, partial [Actinomycetota bacterium]